MNSGWLQAAGGSSNALIPSSVGGSGAFARGSGLPHHTAGGDEVKHSLMEMLLGRHTRMPQMAMLVRDKSLYIIPHLWPMDAL